MDKRYSIALVTYNSRDYLPAWREAIRRQTLQPEQIIVVDNASTDGSANWIEKHLRHAILIRNQDNRGFAVAHNQAIEASEQPFHLILNPDVRCEPAFAEQSLAAFTNGRVGSAGGLLVRETTVAGEHGIDSTGMRMLPWGQVCDRGEGETAPDRYADHRSVFGISGAACMYRRKALDDVRLHGEYFDDDFHSYKEDIDLAWRLRHRGWTARYVPDAIAWHDRQVRGNERWSVRIAHRSNRIAVQSLTNHLFVFLKNMTGTDMLRLLPLMVPYEIAKALTILLLRPGVFASAAKRMVQHTPSMLAKRREILRRRKR